MHVRPICITGEPVLHERAAEVTVFDDELSKLVSDMYLTMEKAPGVGLAATQIGVGLRVFVYDWEDDEGVLHRGEVINPVLELGPISPEPADEESEVEGCLSVPGERFPLKRADQVVLRGVNLKQEPVHIEATGWLARIFQHEFDHLNGTLYVDRLTEPYGSQAQKVVKKQGWGKPGLAWLPGVDDLDA